MTIDADELHEQDMRDPEYRREYDRTRLANDVAIKVIGYRIRHGLSQVQLGRLLGMRQPHVARLEAGDHEPSVATLARLADALGLDFSLTPVSHCRSSAPQQVAGITLGLLPDPSGHSPD
jgi:transcriptional regulator with XRE-family HTH domain